MFFFVLLFSCIFDLLIEKPAHSIAQRAGMFLKGKKSAKITSPTQNPASPTRVKTELSE